MHCKWKKGMFFLLALVIALALAACGDENAVMTSE